MELSFVVSDAKNSILAFIDPVWYASLNIYFYFLNNIIHIFIYFFIHT